MVSGKAGARAIGFDPEALSTFLDMAGPEMRGVLLAQAQQDLDRCRAALAPDDPDCDLDALCKTAHEVKGLAATLGATALAETARHAELACSTRDRAALAETLPALASQIDQACASLSALAMGT